MSERRRNVLVALIVMLTVLFALTGIALAGYYTYNGVVVGLEPKIIRARGKDGTIPVFGWEERRSGNRGAFPISGRK